MTLKNYILLFLFLHGLLVPTALAQKSGNLSIGVTVVPPPISVSITSPVVRFGHVRADAGVVTLDPVTGDINSPRPLGEFSFAKIVLLGGEGRRYKLAITASPPKHSDQDPDTYLNFQPRIARSDSCQETIFEEVMSRSVIDGQLSSTGCATLRVGGQLIVDNAEAGVYSGNLLLQLLEQ